jgi:hypothetical protein
MAKTFFVTLALAIVSFALWTFFWPKVQKPYALQIISSPSAQIFLDSELSGTTPYQNKNLGKSQTIVKLATTSASWSGEVKLTAGTWTIVNRELSDNPLLGAGETLTLEKGKGLYIISTPDQAQVEVDDKKVGQTPLQVLDISPGDHKIVISKEKYVTRAIQAKTHKSYKLVLNVQLSLEQEALARLLAPLTSTPSATLSPKLVKILPTSTGWLRVRDQPSLAGKEIGRIDQGSEVPLLQEEKDWVKIRAEGGLEGWVSAQFAQKVE